MTNQTTPMTTTGPQAAPMITPPVAPKSVPQVTPENNPPVAPKSDDSKTSSTTIDPSRPVLGGSVTLPPAAKTPVVPTKEPAAQGDATKSAC